MHHIECEDQELQPLGSKEQQQAKEAGKRKLVGAGQSRVSSPPIAVFSATASCC